MKACVFLLAVPASIDSVRAMPVYQVQAIGPAGLASGATAINAAGAVVGNYTLADGTTRAFLWSEGQVTTLALPPGAVQTWASAIGSGGQTGGHSYTAAGVEGTVWDHLGQPAVTLGAFVMGLNGAGDVAGMAIAADGAGTAFAVRSGTWASLGQPGGGDWSSANAINASGVAAGTAMTGTGVFRGFLAPPGGVASLLETLGGRNSYGMAINDAGVVAGHAQTGSGALVATVWNGTAAVGLGTLGGSNSFAYAINSAGQVTGYSDRAGGAGAAAFLFENGVMYDLNQLLLPGSGWQLEAGYGINAAGQIAGRGTLNGQQQAFLLTPVRSPLAGQFSADPGGNGAPIPEPGTWWTVGGPLLAYLALRTRHRR